MQITPDTLHEKTPLIKKMIEHNSLAIDFKAAGYSFKTVVTRLETVAHSTNIFGNAGLLITLPFKYSAAIFLCHATPGYVREKLGIPNDLCCHLFADFINELLKE